MPHTYETDGAKIYAESFATIRAEAALDGFDPDSEQIVVRMIHAAGLVGLERDVQISPDFVSRGRERAFSGRSLKVDDDH